MKDNDLKTTILGSGGGLAVLAMVDPVKLGNFDRGEIAKVVLGLVLMGWGYFTNKQKAA